MKRILTSLILAAGALVALPSFAASESLIYYSPATQNHYQAVYTQRYRGGAAQNCVDRGGHLAVANSHPEMEYMQLVMNLDKNSNYWLGESELNGGTSVTTVTGQPFYQDPNFTYYTHTPPYNNGGHAHNLAVVMSTSPPLYFEFTNPSQAHYALCEYEHAPI